MSAARIREDLRLCLCLSLFQLTNSDSDGRQTTTPTLVYLLWSYMTAHLSTSQEWKDPRTTPGLVHLRLGWGERHKSLWKSETIYNLAPEACGLDLMWHAVHESSDSWPSWYRFSVKCLTMRVHKWGRFKAGQRVNLNCARAFTRFPTNENNLYTFSGNDNIQSSTN